MKTYSSVPIVLQVAGLSTLNTFLLDSDARLDLVIAGEDESTTSRMLPGGGVGGKVNVNRRLFLSSASLKRCTWTRVCCHIYR